MTNILKKGFTISVVVATIVWAIGVAAFLPVGANAATEGDLIKMAGLSSVYYYAGGKRNVFPSESVYFSWYSDFSGVKTVSQAELQAIPLGSNVVIRPGTKLVKITTDPKVYAVGPNGVLHHIDSEARATTLYGANWAQRVVDVSDAFFTNYSIGTAISSNVHPEGALIKYASSGDIYRISATGTKQKFSSMAAFSANSYKLSDVLTVSDTLTYTSGADITSAVSSYTDVSQGALVVGGTGGALTVSLASDSPAAQTIPAGVSTVFTKFNFAAGSTAVSVSGFKLTKAGLGTSTYVDNVSVYAGASKVGTSKNINSDHEAQFNFSDLVTVEANTTKVFTIYATIQAAQSGFFALGIKAAADVTSDASSVGGSFPVNGSTFEASGSTTVGNLTFDVEDTDVTKQVGEDGVSFGVFTVEQTNSVEDMWFKGLTLRNNGNVRGADLGTLTLYHDGVAVDTATMDSEKYVAFAFDPIKIKKGQAESFEVKGDIEGGNSGDTIQLYVKDDADVNSQGDTYGYQATVVRTAWDTDDADSTLVTLASGKLNINFDGTAVPAADIKADTDNTVFGKLTIQAPQEPVTVTQLVLTSSGAETGELENAELVDITSGGIIDAATYTFSGSTGTATFTDEFSIAKGATKSFWLRADTTTTSDPASDVYAWNLTAANVTAEGDTSGSAIGTSSIIPSSITSKTMTIVAASLTHQTKTLGAANSLAGAVNVAVYKGTLKASTASDIKVTAFTFNDNAAATSYFSDNDVTKAQLIINDSVVDTKSGEIAEDGSGSDNILTFNGLNYTIPAGKEYTFYLKLDFADTLTGATAFTIDVSNVTAKDSNGDTVAVSEDPVVGPTVTLYSTGVLDVSGSNSEAGANLAVQTTGGKASALQGAFKFDARFEEVKVKDFALFVEDDATLEDDLQRVELVKDDKSTVIGSSSTFSEGDYDGDADTGDFLVTFSDWNYVIKEPGVETVYVRTVFKEIGDGSEQTADAGEAFAYQIYGAGFDVQGNSSGDAITMAAAAAPASNTTSEYENDYTSNAATVYGVTVSSVANDLANGFLTNGQTVVGKFKITVDSGNNTTSTGTAASFNTEDLVFTFSYSGIDTDGSTAGDADFYYYWASDPSVKVTITDFVDGATSDDVDLSTLADRTGTDTIIVEAAQISGAGAAGDYIQVKLAAIDGADFEWNDGISSTINGVKLSYTSVAGGTLSN